MGQTYLGFKNVCLVVLVRENAQKEAHEEGSEPAVGLSVVLGEVQRRHVFTEKQKNARQKVMLDLDTKRGISDVHRQIQKKIWGTFVHFLSNDLQTAPSWPCLMPRLAR